MNHTTRREFIVQTAGALGAVAFMPSLIAKGAQIDGRLDVAVIGAGRQGRSILGELQKFAGVRVVGICDNNPGRLNSGLRRVQGAEGFADHRAMLDKLTGCKAIVIATPTHLHREIAIDCLGAGRHVYCEAPLAHTIEDCRAIVVAARRASGLVFQSGLEGRSNPIYQLARTFFRSDAVREPVSLEAQDYRKTSWRFPSPDPRFDREINWRLDPEVSLGLAGEMGVHQFDVMMWYLDAIPESVIGAGSIRAHDDGRALADTIDCALRFPRGLGMRYGASLGNSHGGRYELLRGTNAAIKLAWTAGWMFKEADAPTQGWEVYANRQQFHNEEGITLIADATQLASQGKLQEGVGLPNPPLYYALGDFIASVAEGKPAICDAEAGARATIVAIHAAKSVTGEEIVRIDPSLFQF